MHFKSKSYISPAQLLIGAWAQGLLLLCSGPTPSLLLLPGKPTASHNVCTQHSTDQFKSEEMRDRQHSAD